jgi:lysozyme
MNISENGINFICGFEGFSSTPYPDPISHAEPYTIGYGTTIYPNGTKVTMQDSSVTVEQAKEFIQDYVSKKIEPFLNCIFNVDTQNKFDALCSFCYNLGFTNLENSTLLKRIKSGEGDIEEAFLMWNRSCGYVVEGLTKRRQAEATLFLT